jgi:uncharacterized protein
VNVDIVYAPVPREVQATVLSLSVGSTVAQALQTLSDDAVWAAVAQEACAELLSTSLWGRRVGLEEVLNEGDRLELCRDLVVDPMVARRERFKSQGSKSAGLFSKRRPGSKAGY